MSRARKEEALADLTESARDREPLRGRVAALLHGRQGPILLTLASAGSGAVLGAVVQSWGSTPLRLAAISAGTLSLLAIGLSAAAVSRDKEARSAQRRMLAESGRLHDDALSRLDDVRAQLAAGTGDSSRAIAALSRQLGVQITFQSIREINSNASVSTDPSSVLIHSVQRELLVLDWLSQDGTWPDESMDRAYMADHQVALIDHIKSLDHGVIYKRICQVDQVGEPLRSMGTAEMFQHLMDMQRLRDEGAQRIVIKFAEKKIPYKFLIVDREGLVLQLQEFTAEGRLKIWGELIIRDPTGHFVEPFLAIWEDMDDSPRTRTITMRDLARARQG